ncbi:MAG: carbamoyltransferase HypF [Sedimentisphaerales bacterium]|nr:carbamoyltransferase HypF [Sedimentisphaerales bacterium]
MKPEKSESIKKSTKVNCLSDQFGEDGGDCGDGGGKQVRRRLGIQGCVQGVGFRPFVYRLARQLGLGGFVGNDSQGAFVEIQGAVGKLEQFQGRLRDELPDLARIASIKVTEIPVQAGREFYIKFSEQQADQQAEITADVTICADCLRELFDPKDRRFRYPFINCTNCGPRYSIIKEVPYDRANTTMAKFRMCPVCQAEYDDPSNRRFHAQPNACSVCGPRVWAADSAGSEIAGDGIKICAEWLREGNIVAIKGLGGFHLACRAENDEVVGRLRSRKGREAKPLALMVGSVEQAEKLVQLDDDARGLLLSRERPIVLVERKADAAVSSAVAEGTDCLGVMLPYTPLHELLFGEDLGPLVMTSGNPTDEPLCVDNDEAVERLSEIADGFLLHNRDIERGLDDSVVMVNVAQTEVTAGSESRKVFPIRRARGFAPQPIRLKTAASEVVLAVGGQMKSVVCLLKSDQAILSEHLGELPNSRTYRNFIRAIERLQKLLRAEPKLIAYDLHPDYVSTRYAKQIDLPAIAVQHHHAHIVSCMADNGISEKVIGIVADGTGYGSDGKIWGCEVMVCDEVEFERFGQLGYFSVPGGDLGAKETWRPAAGLIRQAFGDRWQGEFGKLVQSVPEESVRIATGQLERSLPTVYSTSSLGRLFDAAAFILGICSFNRFEAEAAMALEAAARSSSVGGSFGYAVCDDGDGPLRIDMGGMIAELVEKAERRRCSSSGADGVKTGETADLARMFHQTVAGALAELADRAREQTGIKKVFLSGGCFINRLLLSMLASRLRDLGMEVYTHSRVPTGDGGLALGQAVAAAALDRYGGK